MMRLHKYLAQCGVGSRRKAERLIMQGRVKVNGRVVQPADSVDPENDVILVDEKPVRPIPLTYILLNKPHGVVTTVKDTHGRRTVMECLSGIKARIYPVGRLDLDVEGALILTNDGELANRLMHPRYQVDKVYHAEVEGEVSPPTARRLEQGVELDDGTTAPAKCRILRAGKDSTVLELVLHEGRKREVKRMCAAVGHPVRQLRRVAIGVVSVNGMEPGQWRHLTPGEILSLRRLTGLE